MSLVSGLIPQTDILSWERINQMNSQTTNLDVSKTISCCEFKDFFSIHLKGKTILLKQVMTEKAETYKIKNFLKPNDKCT